MLTNDIKIINTGCGRDRIKLYFCDGKIVEISYGRIILNNTGDINHARHAYFWFDTTDF